MFLHLGRDVAVAEDSIIVVFDMDTVGNLVKVVSGEKIGTYVHN